eukprot:GGOE01058494.1.p1 GENE.GGOE01058494.1~~GGOE01058494.1.p1  ORF type:complete len:376 (-),score=85.54 GGOE01058494.1:619-1719(-)
MASVEHEAAPVVEETKQPEEKVAEAEPVAEGEKVEKPKREPLTPEERAKRKAERLEKIKEQRKAAREAAKEAKARGEAPPPKPKSNKAAPADVVPPEGGAPKITVKLPRGFTVAQLKETFEPYGIIIRAEIARGGLGIVVFNQNHEVRKAVNALNGKHTFPGLKQPVSIQYAKDSVALGELVKKSTDGVADLIREKGYKPGILGRKEAKELINKLVLGRKKPPTTEVLTAAVLVRTKAAKVEDLVGKLVESASVVNELLRQVEKAQPAQVPVKGEKVQKEEVQAAPKPEKTFDAVVPFLDKLEKERWNLMAKANLRFKERHRFRFVDILATPSLELWRWMLEDCDLTAAEAGTCFAILQKYYGYTK